MKINIRPIEQHSEYRQVEVLQREIWGLEEVEIAPDFQLIDYQNNGGLVLGAFVRFPGENRERQIGFAFGFPGVAPDGKMKFASNMAGVHPDFQNLNIGYRLKLAQREWALSRGIDLITWTFDPLESRNAYFNFRKLGVVCSNYKRNYYGEMRDLLNRWLESDRFRVDWHIGSKRVLDRLDGKGEIPSLAGLRASGVAVLDPSPEGDPQSLSGEILPLEGRHTLIRIPHNFQAVKASDIDLALKWRKVTRELFLKAFSSGYTAIDFLHEEGESFYLMEKTPE